jgi:hypothetical protein
LAQKIYDQEKLNCALCILNDFINKNVPPGKTLSKIDLWGNFTTNGDSETAWFATICYAKPKKIIVTQPDFPTFPNGSIMLNSNSILSMY